MRFSKKKYSRCVILCIISVAFVLLFSASTSPIYPNYYGGDSAIFEVIGKYWAEGSVPYRDLFDHKGPFIFFVDMLGSVIGEIWIIQVVFLFATLYGIYDILNNYDVSEWLKYIVTLSSLGILALYYSNGNMTEEYCLPFLVLSISKMLGYFHSSMEEHSPFITIFYGVTFGICLLTRLTNAATICVGIFLIVCQLVRNRYWECLAKNAIAFLMGIGLVVLPFIIYFVEQGVLYDAVYGTILYNISYAQAEQFLIFDNMSLKSFALFLFDYFILLAGIIMGGVLAIRGKIWRGIFACATSLVTLYVCISGQPYLHYAEIALPLYAVVVGDFNEECNRENVSILLSILYGTCAIMWSLNIQIQNYLLPVLHGEEIEEYQSAPLEILNYIPMEDRDSVVGYNVSVSTYLAWDIRPCYTYFHHQDWQGEKSSTLMDEIRKEFSSLEARWIITTEDINGITDILLDHYELKTTLEIENIQYYLYSLSNEVIS